MDTREDVLSEVFGALADPTRRAILQRLAQGEASVAELGAPFAMSQPAISKHLQVLERAGLISRSRSATMRMSRLEADRLREASEWVDRYRRFWTDRFDRLDEALRAFQTDASASVSPTAPESDSSTAAGAVPDSADPRNP
ncbi:ArsR/SmtB family transcription factor [Naasia lichenicola]|uniref:Helix-turn-helix transcriptional regulator n=1 Tax=Naasia lichenicola TaxID=2565933 RepID=A0A4S4FSY2_9MICO|nr:metalloregulator ArsR/SmtB family transcription factor [Naasia lichenicola]THG33421.1 helix-turn-helix transcriptional regulator [Naasia lichenicola]